MALANTLGLHCADFEMPLVYSHAASLGLMPEVNVMGKPKKIVQTKLGFLNFILT